jgi:hypothetical protein
MRALAFGSIADEPPAERVDVAWAPGEVVAGHVVDGWLLGITVLRASGRVTTATLPVPVAVGREPAAYVCEQLRDGSTEVRVWVGGAVVATIRLSAD